MRRGRRVGIMVQCSRFGHGRGETPWFPGCGRAWRGAGAGNTAKQEKNVQKKGQGTVRGQESPGGSAFFPALAKRGEVWYNGTN